ncbi:MAG: PAS domain-containing protein [Treponema sp.]|jgi:two-component system phosphate regulon sensor histidine kinase PhoR|nr:PAS domain-containing protein [Treponema sp.]
MKTVFRQSMIVLSLTTLGLSLSVILSVLFFMDGLYYETNSRSLLGAARLLLASLPPDQIRSVFAEEGGSPFARWLERFPGESPYRITCIGRDGRVLADSRFPPGELENHGERPEVRQALAGAEGQARRSSASLGTELLYAALPVYEADDGPLLPDTPPGTPGRIAGVFRLSVETPDFQSRISPAAPPFLTIAIVLFFLALVLVFLFSRSLSRSFTRLAELARSVNTPETFLRLINSSRLLSDTEECITLEMALKDMASELNLRIEKARREGRRLEAILNGMSEGVFAVDEKGRLHLANRRARALFGMDEQSGAGGLTLLEAARSAELEDAAKEALAGSVPVEREITWHGAGVQRRFQVFAAPFDLDPGGEEPDHPGFWSGPQGGSGVVMVLEDITRLHKLEQVRKDFAANVSHELRTPIQVIKGFAETLLDSPLEDREQIRHVIEIIEKNALAMENLTTDLLSLVSLEDESGHRPEMKNTVISNLLDEAVRSVEINARKKNIAVAIACPPDLSASLNGPLIVQALVNLLDNGMKYSPPDSKLFLEAAADSGELRFTVKDQGTGIPPEHLDRIFERFYRVDRSRSHDPGGTGLGLAIVRHIALLHGGTVEVESHAGEGSVFIIRMKS